LESSTLFAYFTTVGRETSFKPPNATNLQTVGGNFPHEYKVEKIMKKKIFIFIVCFQTIVLSFGQDVEDINNYKYIIVSPASEQSKYRSDLKEFLEQFLSAKSIPIAQSKNELTSKGVNSQDILFCKFYSFSGGPPVYYEAKISFVNSQNHTVISFEGRNNVNWSLGLKAHENVIEKALKGSFSLYSYHYVPIQQNFNNPQSSISTNNINSQNTNLNIVLPPNSDVDNNIPVNNEENNFTFALIIGNEDYTKFQLDLKSEMNVEFARNDATTFKEYCIKTLGIPEKNITFIIDGTFGQISQGLSKLNLIAKITDKKASIIFYYAGHGLPDESTKEPYLIPVDINSSNLSSALKLKDIYSKLTEFPCEKITVFLDACFTGGGRNQGLFAARGVKIKPKDELLNGNIIVFSSSSGEQSSLPYKEKQHGLFTYYLLKKVQETKGELTYKALSDFLTEKISLESVLINSKEQNPQTNISSDVSNKWENWKLK